MAQGVRLPGLPVAIDLWCAQPGVQYYLLTHAHADHTEGLCSTWAHGCIVTSHDTRELILAKFALDPRVVLGLDVGETHTLALEPSGEVLMEVTLIPANHCLGAVMFVLRGFFGTIVHTGDFRACDAMFAYAELTREPVDALYLDNSFCEPRYEFPDRAEAGAHVASIVQPWLAGDERRVVLLGVDTLGKEELCLSLARRCGVRIYAPEWYHGIALLPSDSRALFVRSQGLARIVLVARRMLSEATAREWNAAHPARPCIAVLPSGLQPVDAGAPSGPLLHRVAYSSHSSHSELVRFVRRLAPRQLFPIVPASAAAAVRLFGGLCDRTPPRPVVAPAALRDFLSLRHPPRLWLAAPSHAAARALPERSRLRLARTLARPAVRGLRLALLGARPGALLPEAHTADTALVSAPAQPRKRKRGLCDWIDGAARRLKRARRTETD